MKKFFAAAFVAVTAVNLTGCSLLKRESPRGEPNSSPMSSSYLTTTSTDTQPSKSSTDNLSKPESSTTTEKSAEESTSESASKESGTPEEISAPEESSQPAESASGDILGDIIRPDVKEAIDSYEAFIDEYCEFMKKYASSDNPLMLMSEYMDYLQELTEMGEKFDNMDESDWTAAETAYYTEVLLRCQKKLLDAADEM